MQLFKATIFYLRKVHLNSNNLYQYTNNNNLYQCAVVISGNKDEVTVKRIKVHNSSANMVGVCKDEVLMYDDKENCFTVIRNLEVILEHLDIKIWDIPSLP